MPENQRSAERSQELCCKFFTAAVRQGEISRYHLWELHRDLCPDPCPYPIPVPVQAHFEGVIISAVAVEDKIAMAISQLLGDKTGDEDKNRRIFEKLTSHIEGLRCWLQKPIRKDLRAVRALVVHQFSNKRPDAPGLVIEKPSSEYGESPELREYCFAAVKHAHELTDLIPELKRELWRRLSARRSA